MTYVPLDEFKTWLELPSEDLGGTDHHLYAILEAADRWIDSQCGRHFSVENEATKLYYPSEPDYLDVVDLISITSLKLDTSGDRTFATTLAADEYALSPYMDDSGRPSTRYQQIHVWPTSSHGFTPGELVQIVGDFGYVVDGTVPSEIRLAALMLSSRWWKAHETAGGTAIIPDMGSFGTSSDNSDIKMLLDTYNRSSSSAWVLV